MLDKGSCVRDETMPPANHSGPTRKAISNAGQQLGEQREAWLAMGPPPHREKQPGTEFSTISRDFDLSPSILSKSFLSDSIEPA